MLPPDARHIDPVEASTVAHVCTLTPACDGFDAHAATAAIACTEALDAQVARLRAEVAHEPQFNAAALPPHTAGKPTAEEIDACRERAAAVMRTWGRP